LLETNQEELTRLLQEQAKRKRANVVQAPRRTVKERLKKDIARGKHCTYYPLRSKLGRMEAEVKFDKIHNKARMRLG
jgi:hypothetical protein